jgi:hypothetical protein
VAFVGPIEVRIIPLEKIMLTTNVLSGFTIFTLWSQG